MIFDESGKEIAADEELYPVFKGHDIKIETCGMVSGLKGSRVQPTSCYAFSRLALSKILIHISDGSKWEASADDLLITIAKLGHMKMIYSGSSSVCYRLHGGNLSTRRLSTFSQQKKVLNRAVFVSDTLRSLNINDCIVVDAITRGIPMSKRDFIHTLEMIVYYSNNSISVLCNIGKFLYRYSRSANRANRNWARV